MRELRASDIDTVRFASIDGRLFWAWGDLANAVVNCLGNPLCATQYRRGLTLGPDDTTKVSGGNRGNPLMLCDAKVPAALMALAGRPDYDIEKSRRLQRRMKELTDEIGASLTDTALEVAQAEPPAAASIAKMTLGASEILPLPPPAEPESVVPPYPLEATPGIEELKRIAFDAPTPTQHRASQMVERMGALEAAVDRLTDRLGDAVEALGAAQAGIERRDEQIASLERLIALAGQHLTQAVRQHS